MGTRKGSLCVISTFSCRYCCSKVLILIIWKWLKCPHIIIKVINTTQTRIFLMRKTSLVPWIHYVIDWFYTSILKTLCRTQCVNCSFADTELRMRLARSCVCSIVYGQAGVLKFNLEYSIYVSLFQWKLLKFLIRFSIKCCWMYSPLDAKNMSDMESICSFFKNLHLPSLIRFCITKLILQSTFALKTDS